MVAVVECGAGAAASITDADYEAAGAKIATDLKDAWGSADIVVKVTEPAENADLGMHEADALKPGAIVVPSNVQAPSDDVPCHTPAGTITCGRSPAAKSLPSTGSVTVPSGCNSSIRAGAPA